MFCEVSFTGSDFQSTTCPGNNWLFFLGLQSVFRGLAHVSSTLHSDRICTHTCQHTLLALLEHVPKTSPSFFTATNTSTLYVNSVCEQYAADLLSLSPSTTTCTSNRQPISYPSSKNHPPIIDCDRSHPPCWGIKPRAFDTCLHSKNLESSHSDMSDPNMRGQGINVETGNRDWSNRLSKGERCKTCGKTFTMMENTAVACLKKQQHQAEEKGCCTIL